MPTTVYLSEYNMTVKQGKQETVIPYAGINEVVLNKGGGKVFRTQLRPEGGRPIVITNTYYTSEKTVEDRSRAYATFVRVLHFHLKDKSKATFMSGNRLGALWLTFCTATALAFLISSTIGYLGFGFINPLVDGAMLAVLFDGIIAATMLGRFPKHYVPGDIPLEFLP